MQPAQQNEGRVLWTATITLGLLLGAHTLMETGRDALFLANIPVERLPWVYIAVAFLALLVVRLAGRGQARLQARLVALQLVAALSVFAFWYAMGAGPWLYYALYAWGGVISSVVVVSFWMLLGDLFTITQGKRLFASIAIGGAAGALLGSALATWIAPNLGAEALLLASSGFFALSAVGPLTLRGSTESNASQRDTDSDSDFSGLRDGIRKTLSHPYARRVAMLVALASATLTLGDYLFKSVLSEEVPPEQLSTSLAQIYFGLNLLSITMLAVGVTPFVRRLGVDRSLALLPGLIAIATLGVFAGVALFAIVLLKATDGTLRYSLHKTATELLYLPMDSALRTSVKGVIDLVGGNVAKALASVAILLLVTAPEPRLVIALSLLMLSVIWAVAALKLRQPYLDVFRTTLSRDAIDTHIEYPELDVASVETLIRALSDRDPRAVIAAMDVLVERDRCSLIPSLILYHPTPAVVSRAVDIFTSAGRDHLLDFQDRLLAHEYASVRAAIVRGLAVLAPDREQLEELAGAGCPCIRVSALAGLVAHGWVDPERADREFQSALVHPEPDTRMAVANAAKLRHTEIYRRCLPQLARDPNTEVAREAVRAMCKSDDPWYTAALIALLDDRRVRDLVRPALLERGDDALAQLSSALEDANTPVSVLRHIPQTISRFSSPAAVTTLLRGLNNVRSGMVRYKILRGLQPLMATPLAIHADKALILAELRSTVERALSLLHNEVVLQRGQSTEEARRTAGGRILLDVVGDKTSLATGRIFLLLSLLYPSENFRRIESGVRSQRTSDQASGIELLDNLLPSDLRRPTIGLVSQGTPAERLQRADADRGAARIEYGAAVRTLARDSSESVKAFAMYHAGEIGLELAEAPAPEEAHRPSSSLRDRAIGVIERLPDALALSTRPNDPEAAA